MKLLYCKKCGDIFNLDQGVKTCSCGRVSGAYTNSRHAFYSGDAIPLGFSNSSMLVAISKWKYNGKRSETFTAFVIEKNCPTFTKEG